MADEIEFKFLTKFTSEEEIIRLGKPNCLHLKQGYLSTDVDCTVRVRDTGIGASRSGNITFTIKGKNEGPTRKEFEFSLPRQESLLDIFSLCKTTLSKTRYLIPEPISGYAFEVDVFHGENQGLILAEIEVNKIEDKHLLCLPWWIGEEVTYDSRYYSSNLAVTPFNSWVK